MKIELLGLVFLVIVIIWSLVVLSMKTALPPLSSTFLQVVRRHKWWVVYCTQECREIIEPLLKGKTEVHFCAPPEAMPTDPLNQDSLPKGIKPDMVAWIKAGPPKYDHLYGEVRDLQVLAVSSFNGEMFSNKLDGVEIRAGLKTAFTEAFSGNPTIPVPEASL